MIRFRQRLDSLEERDYLLARVAFEAAPTIGKVKPSSLVTFSEDPNSRNLRSLWEKYKDEVSCSLGLHYFELRKTERFVLVLFFHQDAIERILAEAENRTFLRKMGYSGEFEVSSFLEHLSGRERNDFPHEIGILLGIPKEDILAFIRCGGDSCICCGYWKVYSEPQRAIRAFRRYDIEKVRVMNGICGCGPEFFRAGFGRKTG